MASIDRLEVEIESSSTDAAQQVASLADQLERLKGIINGTWKDPIKKIMGGDTTSKGKASSDTSTIKSEGNAAKKTAADFAKAELNAIKANNAAEKYLHTLKETTKYMLPEKGSAANIGYLVQDAMATYEKNVPQFGGVADYSDDVFKPIKPLSAEQIEQMRAFGDAANATTKDILTISNADFKSLSSSLATADRQIQSLDSSLSSAYSKIESLRSKGVVDEAPEMQDAIASYQNFAEIMQSARKYGGQLDEALSKVNGTVTDVPVEKMNELAVAMKNALSAARSASVETASALKGVSIPTTSKGGRAKVSGTTEQAEQEVRGLRRAWNSLKEKIGLKVDSSEVKTAHKHVLRLSKLLHSISRIAMYRAIRTAMKMVTSVFKEGIENLYQYSKLVGTDFAPMMDRASTASLYLKNALGSMAGQVLQAVIPAFDSMIDTLVEGINAVTQFFAALAGRDTWSRPIKQAHEYAEAVTDATKAQKSFMLGIDELNVIEEAQGGAGSKVPDYSTMFEEVAVDEDIKNLADKLKDILKIVGEIGLALAGWKIASTVVDFFGNLLGKDLSKVTQFLLGITLVITGFTLQKDAFKTIFDEGADIGSVLQAAIGGGLEAAGFALIGKALGLTTGVSLLLGLGAAILLTVGAIRAAISENLSEKVKEAFYEEIPGAISITDIAADFEIKVGQITAVNQPIIDAGNTIKRTTDEQIKPAVTAINEIAVGIELGAFTAEEKIPLIEEKFRELRDGTATILEEVYNNVVRAVSTSLYKALEDAGIYVPELLGVLAQVKGDVDEQYAAIVEQQETLKKQYNDGALSADQYATKMLGLAQQLEGLVGATNPAKTATAEFNDALANVNFENEESVTAAFSRIKDAAAGGVNSINEAYQTIKDNVATMRSWSDDPDYQLALDKILIANEDTRKAQISEIETSLQQSFDDIQVGMLNRMSSTVETAKEDWDNLGFWRRLFSGGGEEEHVEQALNDLQTNYMTPISNSMQEILSEIGLNGNVWATSAMDTVMDGLFEDKGMEGSLSDRMLTYKSDINTELNKVFSSVGVTQKSNAYDAGVQITEGLKNGLLSGVDTVTQAALQIAKIPNAKIREKNQIKSPSRLMWANGKYIDEGLANGISNNSNLVTLATEAMSNDVLTAVYSIETGISSTASSITTALSSMFDYDPTTDYMALIKEACDRGDVEAAAMYEQLRNAKIAGEGLSYEQTDYFKDRWKTATDEVETSLSSMFDYDPTADWEWELDWNENLGWHTFYSDANGKWSTLYTDIDSGWSDTLATINRRLTDEIPVVEYTTNTIKQSFEKMTAQSIDAIERITTSLNAIPRNITTTHTIVTRAVTAGFASGQTAPKQYAQGGFPDAGQLFVARERGAELVGAIGNRTAVANNQQIEDGIYKATKEASQEEVALMREQNELLRALLAKDTSVTLDGKTLKTAVDRANRESGVSIMAGGVRV